MLPSLNAEWGFYGTMATAHPGHEAAAWQAAFSALEAVAGPGTPPEAVRFFLDGRYGRHFADDVLNAWGGSAEAAVAEAVARWQGWRLSSRTAKEMGIPRLFVGRPLLEALLVYAEVAIECSLEA